MYPMMLRIGDLDVNLPSERSPALASYLGKVVIAGIRPEDIHDPDFLPPACAGARLAPAWTCRR